MIPVAKFHTTTNCIRNFRTCEGYWMMVLPTGLWHICINNLFIASICQDSVCIYMHIWFERHGMVHALNARQFDRAYRCRVCEFYFYPIRLISWLDGKKVDVILFAGHQLFPSILAISFHFFQFQWLACISFWSREGQYSNIPIVAPFFLVGLWYGKIGLNLFSLYVGTTIDDGTHSIFRLDPRPTRHGPSRAILHGETQSQSFAFFGGMSYGGIPILTQTLDVVGSGRPLSTKLTMKELHT